MKNALVLTILVFCNSILFGQGNCEFLTSKANSADMIVEGKITNKRVYFDTLFQCNFTEYEIEVYRQFKGEITKIVYFKIKGGFNKSTGIGHKFSHSTSVGLYREGVFFLQFYTLFGYPYLMLSSDNSILRYYKRGERIVGYVCGYEYHDLSREIYASLGKCTDCYIKQIKY